MNAFDTILTLPGAAAVLADKLSGRIISRVAAGFADDPALGDMMNLYKALEAQHPVLSLREMFELQLKDAASEAPDLSDLTPEQREIWNNEPTANQSRRDRLQAALPTIVDLYAAATPQAESWDDLTTINQWSLLNATERGVYDRLHRYETWAAEDEAKGREDTNAIRRRDQTIAVVEPLFELITKFLQDKHVIQDLDAARDDGIRVPARRTA
jgi:hypothetical protein